MFPLALELFHKYIEHSEAPKRDRVLAKQREKAEKERKYERQRRRVERKRLLQNG
jgi:hypothetical protein